MPMNFYDQIKGSVITPQNFNSIQLNQQAQTLGQIARGNMATDRAMQMEDQRKEIARQNATPQGFNYQRAAQQSAQAGDQQAAMEYEKLSKEHNDYLLKRQVEDLRRVSNTLKDVKTPEQYAYRRRFLLDNQFVKDIPEQYDPQYIEAIDRASADLTTKLRTTDYDKRAAENEEAKPQARLKIAEWRELLKVDPKKSPYPASVLDALEFQIENGEFGASKFINEHATGTQRNQLAADRIRTTTPASANQAAAEVIAKKTAEQEVKDNLPGQYSGEQYKVAGFGVRMEQAEKDLEELFAKGFNPASLKNAVVSNDAFNALKSPEQQRYAQAMRNFINASLRRESGAAIAPAEFDNANKQYFAQFGDKSEVTEQKRRNRASQRAMMKSEAAGAYNEVKGNYEKEVGVTKKTDSFDDLWKKHGGK